MSRHLTISCCHKMFKFLWLRCFILIIILIFRCMAMKSNNNAALFLFFPNHLNVILVQLFKFYFIDFISLRWTSSTKNLIKFVLDNYTQCFSNRNFCQFKKKKTKCFPNDNNNQWDWYNSCVSSMILNPSNLKRFTPKHNSSVAIIIMLKFETIN